MDVNMIDTKIKIRRAVIDDLFSIIKLLADDELGNKREIYNNSLPNEYYVAFANIDKDSNNYLVVATYENIVIGTLQLTIIQHLTHTGSKRGHIEGVRIDSAYRSRGFGRLLIQWAINKSRELNCHMMQLTTNKQRTSALNFYEKIGFIASHEGLKFYL